MRACYLQHQRPNLAKCMHFKPLTCSNCRLACLPHMRSIRQTCRDTQCQSLYSHCNAEASISRLKLLQTRFEWLSISSYELQRIQLVIRQGHLAKQSVPLACKWRGAMTGCCQWNCAPCTCSLQPVVPAHPLCTHRTLRKPSHYTQIQCIHFSMPASIPWSTAHVTMFEITKAWRRACQLCSASARQPGLHQRKVAAI